MSSIFEILEYRDLITNDGVKRSSIEALSGTEIFDLANAILTLSVTTEVQDTKSIFSHSASLSLGGGREDCYSLECRTSRLNELARFALLYSDQVFIKNWFLDYAHIRRMYNPKKAGHKESLLKYFYDDLSLLWKVRPFLENGYIHLFTPVRHTCPACLAEISFGANAAKRLEEAYEKLAKEYLANTSLRFKKGRRLFAIECKGPETYFEHGGIHRTFYTAPEPLASMPRVMAKVLKGETVQISKTVQKQLKFHNKDAAQVIQNVQFDLAAARALNTSFLTNKPLHISFLQTLSNEQNIEQRNSIAYNHLSSMVPFVEDVDLHDLMKLRDREEEAFITYRQALNKAIDEFRERKTEFTRRDAQSLYSDVVAPSLSSLEQKVQEAKSDLVKKPLMSIGALVGVISFGMYTGFLPAELMAMAKSLGLSKVLYDLIEKSIALSGVEKNIRNEELYFLWKVKRKTHSQ